MNGVRLRKDDERMKRCERKEKSIQIESDAKRKVSALWIKHQIELFHSNFKFMAATFPTHISPFLRQTESNLKWFTLIYDSGFASLSPSFFFFFLLRHSPICLLTLWWLSRKCEKSWVMVRANVRKKKKSKMFANNNERAWKAFRMIRWHRSIDSLLILSQLWIFLIKREPIVCCADAGRCVCAYTAAKWQTEA